MKGVYTALVTPFGANDSLDIERWHQLLESQCQAQVAGVVIGGTTGEAPTLSIEEMVTLMNQAQRYRGRIKIVAGCGGNSTAKVLALIEALAPLADAIMLINPYYNKSNYKGLDWHFSTLLGSCDKPTLLYNVPQRTGQAIPVDLVASLRRRFPHLVAFKEASNDFSYTLALLCGNPGLAVLSGNDYTAPALLGIGGAGIISVASNIIPNQINQLYQEFQVSFARGIASYRRLEPLLAALNCDVNPIPIKALMNATGISVGPTRLPLGPINDDDLIRLINLKEAL